jgi:hypothetical protein
VQDILEAYELKILLICLTAEREVENIILDHGIHHKPSQQGIILGHQPSG